ncbi:MAG: hypothetical protein IPG93_18155 [Burkholderiales bacterium]|nr:hypothetical protein [Burkholderiales bacterium]
MALLKILPEEGAEDFLNGSLYMNTATYFGRIDRTDEVRFDPHDGVHEAIQAARVEIMGGNGEWLDLGGVNNPITVRNYASERLNVLCLYMISDRDCDAFDSRNLSFGDKAILINNVPHFFERLRAAAASDGKKIGAGPIEYMDKATHSGRMGPFRKFHIHSYQNEYRIVVDGGTGSACRLEVGDLRDISAVIASSGIPQLWAAMRRRGALKKVALSD